MEKSFFVMLYNQNGEYASPLIEDVDSDDVTFFESEEEAEEIMSNHPYGQAFGYKIFNMDD